MINANNNIKRLINLSKGGENHTPYHLLLMSKAVRPIKLLSDTSFMNYDFSAS